MRLTFFRSPFVLLVPLSFAAALAASPLPAPDARSSGAETRAADDGEGRSPAYREAQRALDEARWEEAAQRFGAVADEKNADADAALYWKAYAEEKLGRKAAAMQTLKALRADHPKSVWSDDAAALEIAISGESGPRSRSTTPDDELQMYALDGLMQMDSARALPILEKILAGDRGLQIKQRALFVLSQSDEPRARTLLVATARNGKPAELQIEAVRSLGIAGDPEDIQALSELYRASPSRDTRAAVLEAFLVAGEETPLLAAARAETDPELRGKAIELLGALGSTGSLAELYKSESAREFKAKILEGLMIAGDEDRLLAAARGESDGELRGKAIELLGAVGADTALVELYQSTQDHEQRGKIITGLMISGNGKAMIGLLRKETDPELKKVIVRHLSMMNDDEALDEIERLLTEKP